MPAKLGTRVEISFNLLAKILNGVDDRIAGLSSLGEFRGASHCFRSGGCDAASPPIEEDSPTQVCEAASDDERSVGTLSTRRTPPFSIQRE